jgi:hypothetical protein
MAGMAVAIPIHKVDGRRYTNKVNKVFNVWAIWLAANGQFIKLLVKRKSVMASKPFLLLLLSKC